MLHLETSRAFLCFLHRTLHFFSNCTQLFKEQEGFHPYQLMVMKWKVVFFWVLELINQSYKPCLYPVFTNMLQIFKNTIWDLWSSNMDQCITLTKIIPSAWNPWQMWRSELVYSSQLWLKAMPFLSFFQKGCSGGGKGRGSFMCRGPCLHIAKGRKSAYIFSNVVLPSDVTGMDPISSFQLWCSGLPSQLLSCEGIKSHSWCLQVLYHCTETWEKSYLHVSVPLMTLIHNYSIFTFRPVLL